MKRFVFLLVCLSLSTAAVASEDDPVQVGIFQTYLKLAEEGDMNAQYIVAHRYEIGKGTAADTEKANYWYDRAAAKGHPLALRKVEEREPPAPAVEEVAAKPASQVAAASAPVAPAPPKPAPAVKAPPKAVAKGPPARPKPAPVAVRHEKAPPPTHAAAEHKAKEPQLVAKAAAEQPSAPSINIMATVLGGQWSRNRQPAEFLPSTRAACLQSSRSEIVCFSNELTRNVGGAGVTYNVKTTLSGLDNREGRFALSYVYNVLHVGSKPESQALVADMGDLEARTGWQEPGQTLECRFQDERSLACARADRKLSLQFARD